MNKLLTFLGLALISTSVWAAEKLPTIKARIDVNGRGIVLKPVSGPKGGYIRNINWGKKDLRKFNLIGETAPIGADKWIKASFSFIPEKDSKVTINLMSNYSRDKGKKQINAHWVYFDMVTVEGSELKNGDFEEAKDGKPVGWSCGRKDVYVTAGAEAFSGKAMVQAWHNIRARQGISVKKGQKVTITVHVKFAKLERAKK